MVKLEIILDTDTHRSELEGIFVAPFGSMITFDFFPDKWEGEWRSTDQCQHAGVTHPDGWEIWTRQNSVAFIEEQLGKALEAGEFKTAGLIARALRDKKAAEVDAFKIVNLSGHPINQAGVVIVASADNQNVDLADLESIRERAADLAQIASDALELHPSAFVALPGLTTLAVTTTATIHGLTGAFPRIAWAARTDEGKFVWSKDQALDLQTLRNEQRLSR